MGEGNDEAKSKRILNERRRNQKDGSKPKCRLIPAWAMKSRNSIVQTGAGMQCVPKGTSDSDLVTITHVSKLLLAAGRF